MLHFRYRNNRLSVPRQVREKTTPCFPTDFAPDLEFVTGWWPRPSHAFAQRRSDRPRLSAWLRVIPFYCITGTRYRLLEDRRFLRRPQGGVGKPWDSGCAARRNQASEGFDWGDCIFELATMPEAPLAQHKTQAAPRATTQPLEALSLDNSVFESGVTNSR